MNNFEELEGEFGTSIKSSWDLVEVCVELIRTSERAILIRDYVTNKDGKKVEKEIWLPKSTCLNPKWDDNCLTIHLPQFMANSKGMI